MANHRSERRAVREKFRKRTPNFIRKGNELSQATKADVYILIYHNDKYRSYKSTNRLGWPPSEHDIVSRLALVALLNIN